MHRCRCRLLAGLGVATALAMSAAGRVSGQTLSLNLHEALGDTKAVLASGGVANILVIGDSLSFRPGTWIYPFRASVQSVYGDAGTGYQAMSWWTGAGTNQGWTFGWIGQDTPPHHSLDGLWMFSTSGQGTPGNPTNAVHTVLAANISTHLVAGPGGGAVRITYPGEAPVDVGTFAPADDVLAIPHEVPGAGSQVWFQPLGTGKVTVLGHNNLTGNPGVVVHRAANGGWGVNNFLQRDWTFDRQLQLIGPSLVMIWLGQNDQGHSRSAYAGLISSLVDRVLLAVPGAEILLVGTYDAGGTAIPILVGGMEDVAQNRGLGFINMYAAGGPVEFYSANGYLEDGHFSAAGGDYVGGLVYDAFMTETVAPFCGAVIGEQPAGVTADPGADVSFHVVATATVEMSYQWRRNGAALTDDGRITGAQTATLEIDAVAVGDGGTYTAMVTTDCGFVVSDGAALQVVFDCRPDFNGDGFLDGIDSDQFNNAFEAGYESADYNEDGFVDGIDYDWFMNDFEAGC